MLTTKQINTLLSGEYSEMFTLLYNGLNSKETAAKLGVCFRTVHTRVSMEGNRIGIAKLTPTDVFKSKLLHLKKEGKTIGEIKKFAGYKTFAGLEFLFE